MNKNNINLIKKNLKDFQTDKFVNKNQNCLDNYNNFNKIKNNNIINSENDKPKSEILYENLEKRINDFKNDNNINNLKSIQTFLLNKSYNLNIPVKLNNKNLENLFKKKNELEKKNKKIEDEINKVNKTYRDKISDNLLNNLNNEIKKDTNKIKKQKSSRIKSKVKLFINDSENKILKENKQLKLKIEKLNKKINELKNNIKNVKYNLDPKFKAYMEINFYKEKYNNYIDEFKNLSNDLKKELFYDKKEYIYQIQQIKKNYDNLIEKKIKEIYINKIIKNEKNIKILNDEYVRLNLTEEKLLKNLKKN
jgi:hypothetical protein